MCIPWKELKERGRKLVRRVGEELPDLPHKNVEHLFDHSEFRLGFEFFVDNLCDAEATLSRASYSELLELIQLIQLDQRYRSAVEKFLRVDDEPTQVP